MNYQSYLETDYWKAVAGAVKAKAKFRCQVCNSPHDLNAHHRSYDHRGDELNHLDDLICLCRRCHGIFHGKIEEPQKQMPQIVVKQKPGRITEFEPAKIDQEMNAIEGEPIMLTKELLRLLMTSKHGMTNATIRVLPVDSWVKGWARRLIGRPITRSNFRIALEGRYRYGTGQLELAREAKKLRQEKAKLEA
jgi:hypothetical protein